MIVNHEVIMTSKTEPRTVLAARLRQLRMARGLSLEALASAMGGLVSKQALSKYEQGQAMPTPRVLTEVARALGVKAMALAAPAGVEVEIVAFRKTSGLGSKERNRIEGLTATMLEQRVRLQELTEQRDGSEIPVRGIPVTSVDDCEDAALTMRRRWGLGSDPLANVTETLEEHHVHVFQVDAGTRFDGMAAIARRARREVAGAAVVSKRGVSGERQRLNLAHELGHLVLSVPEDVDEEKAAFRFAGAFLAPAERIRADVGAKRSAVSFPELLLLKQRYGLSLQALVYRLRDLAVISAAHAAALWATIKKRGWWKREPGELAPERPTWAHRATLRALTEGLLSADEARGLLGEALSEGLAEIPGQRRAFLRLPIAERRRILTAQAERSLEHYVEDQEWRALADGAGPDA